MTPSHDDAQNRPPSFTPQPSPAARPRSTRGARPVGDEQVDATKVSPVSSGPARPSPRSGRPQAPAFPPGETSGSAGPHSRTTSRPTASPRAASDADGGTPNGPGHPGNRSATTGGGSGRRHHRRRLFIGLGVLVLVLLLIAWPVGLVVWANGKLQHVDALSSHSPTSGTTYLIAGSDSRAETDPNSHVAGARTDTIMLLHVPEDGTTSLISIPRDSYVEIPGHGSNKINASYSFGGPPLLVKTVEKLTGMRVDHFVEIGFGGVENIVDAVGGVHLCLDYNVKDKKSKLHWKSGCHEVKGKKALAFSRMRYADPKGDIGRTERQRQVIGAISDKLKNPALLVQPGTQVSLIKSAAGSMHVDEDASVIDLARLALAFRAAEGSDGVTGTPPIKDLGYHPGGVGSAVLLDPDKTPAFFKDVRDGKLEPGTVNGM